MHETTDKTAGVKVYKEKKKNSTKIIFKSFTLSTG